MAFMTSEIIVDSVKKFLNTNIDSNILLGLTKGTLVKALCAVNTEQLNYNHLNKTVQIKSGFSVSNDAKDKAEWAMYAMAIFMSVEDITMIKKIELLQEGAGVAKAVSESSQKSRAAEEYVVSLWKCAIERLRTEYENEMFSCEDRKFFRALHKKILVYKEEGTDFGFFIEALRTDQIQQLDEALNKGYDCVPSKMVEYLESFLF